MSDFPHHRLDAYRVALELASAAQKIADSVSRGHAAIVDQLKRSSTAVPLLVAEGANRSSAAQKRQRFVEARGECAEAAAAAEVLATLEVADSGQVELLIETADRTAAILGGLIRKYER